MISKFSSLPRTDVEEQIETTWDQWLDHLASRPTEQWTGTLKHPGWSPVVYDPPKRLGENIKSVSALVLDYDKGGTWEAVTALWESSYGLVYTTKSHTAEHHRLRVVLPLQRTVTADEYRRLWLWAERRSEQVGCIVDKNAKDASRFWYDPTPVEDWRSQRLNGDGIDPDAILALEPEQPKLRVVRATQQPTNVERYKRASAYLAKIPGAVAYEGGHTATFNATAHVMFGFDLSESDTLQLLSTEYNPRCEPPWSEHELEHKVQSVAKKCKRERGYLLVDRPRIDTTKQAASYAPPAADLEVDWSSLLLVKKDRSIRRGYHNVAVFVRHHPDYRGKWSLDQMTGQPWFDGEPMSPEMVHTIRAAADCRMGFTPPTADVEAAIIAAATDRPFHPILQYLRSLDWDGIPRLASMARDFLGSDSEMHASMVRKFMIGAAARALWPGCKQDTALMLVGAQGLRKSTFFATLGGQWHADTYIDIAQKDGMMQLHSAWIYELSELENVVMGRAESRLKAWMSSSHDMYRAPYQRTVTRRPRAVVICGSTNREQILTDDTGSRRFWIVPVHQPIPIDLLVENRDQLWAEAVCAAESGEPWWLHADEDEERAQENIAYMEEDSWTEIVAEWLATRPPPFETSIHDVLRDAVKLESARQDRWSQMRAARVLKACGWTRCRPGSGSRDWKYRKVGTVPTSANLFSKDGTSR